MGLRSSKFGNYNSQRKEEKDERSYRRKAGKSKRRSSSIFDRRRKRMNRNERDSLQEDFDKVNIVKYDPVSNKPQNAEELHHIDDVLACLPANVISRKYPEFLQRNSVANESLERTDKLSEKDNENSVETKAENLVTGQETVNDNGKLCTRDGSEKQNGDDSKINSDEQVDKISSKLAEIYKLLSEIKEFLKNYTTQHEDVDNFELTAKYCSVDEALDTISASLDKTETNDEKYNEEKGKLLECVELFRRIIQKRLEFFNENEERAVETEACGSVTSSIIDEEISKFLLEIRTSPNTEEYTEEDKDKAGFSELFRQKPSAPCNSPIDCCMQSDDDEIDSDDSWSEQATASPCGSPSKEDIVYVDYNGLYTIKEEDEEES